MSSCPASAQARTPPEGALDSAQRNPGHIFPTPIGGQSLVFAPTLHSGQNQDHNRPAELEVISRRAPPGLASPHPRSTRTFVRMLCGNSDESDEQRNDARYEERHDEEAQGLEDIARPAPGLNEIPEVRHVMLKNRPRLRNWRTPFRRVRVPRKEGLRVPDAEGKHKRGHQHHRDSDLRGVPPPHHPLRRQALSRHDSACRNLRKDLPAFLQERLRIPQRPPAATTHNFAPDSALDGSQTHAHAIPERDVRPQHQSRQEGRYEHKQQNDSQEHLHHNWTVSPTALTVAPGSATAARSDAGWPSAHTPKGFATSLTWRDGTLWILPCSPRTSDAHRPVDSLSRIRCRARARVCAPITVPPMPSAVDISATTTQPPSPPPTPSIHRPSGIATTTRQRRKDVDRRWHSASKRRLDQAVTGRRCGHVSQGPREDRRARRHRRPNASASY